MKHEFWREKWERNEIAFHEGAPNAHLVKYFGALGYARGARVFLPLCGKTRDIHWLLSQGHEVAGAELSELAVAQLFEELGLTPEKTQIGGLVRYSAPNIDIFQGDIFELNAETLGAVHIVFDRAALIALPPEMRARYAAHLVRITHGASGLLVALEYDQSLMSGPPFSVTENEARLLYQDVYDIRILGRIFAAEGLKGQYPATEVVCILWRKLV